MINALVLLGMAFLSIALIIAVSAVIFIIYYLIKNAIEDKEYAGLIYFIFILCVVFGLGLLGLGGFNV